jgi:hypothetical protein
MSLDEQNDKLEEVRQLVGDLEAGDATTILVSAGFEAHYNISVFQGYRDKEEVTQRLLEIWNHWWESHADEIATETRVN